MKKVKKRLGKKDVLTIPNAMSVFRILLIPVIIYLYAFRKNYVPAICILVLSAVTDIADGWIARHFHMVSDLGKLLDPIADKLTQGAILICLTPRYPYIWILVGIFALKELLMFCMNGIVLHYTDTINSAKWYGKAATVILEVSMGFLILLPDIPRLIANILMALCLVAIVGSFVLYAVFYASFLRDFRKNDTTEKTDTPE